MLSVVSDGIGASISLGWNPSSSPGAAGYFLYYGTATHQYSRQIDAKGNLTATVTNLTEGLPYYFSVTTYDSSGVESLGSPELAYVVPGPPKGVTLSSAQVTQTVSANVAVGTLGSIEPGALKPFTYSLVAGSGSTANSLFSISGSTLTINNVSGVSPGAYSVRIQTDDGNGGTLATNLTVTVVAATPPVITGVQGPAIGVYGVGANLDFIVTFNAPVIVSPYAGIPHFALRLGTSTVQANYVSGTGTSTLLFRYVVQPGDNAPLGVILPSLQAIGGGIIYGATGYGANLALAAASWTGALVNTALPLSLNAAKRAAHTAKSAGFSRVSLEIEPVAVQSGGRPGDPFAPARSGFRIFANAQAGRAYSLLVSSNLVDWSLWTNAAAGTNGVLEATYDDPSAPAALFFRAVSK